MQSPKWFVPQALLAHNMAHMRTYQRRTLHFHTKRRILATCGPANASNRLRMPDRRPLLAVFRTRLESLIDDAGLSRVAYAEQIGVDRSTLSQLLSENNRRLPRVETLARIAR